MAAYSGSPITGLRVDTHIYTEELAFSNVLKNWIEGYYY